MLRLVLRHTPLVLLRFSYMFTNLSHGTNYFRDVCTIGGAVSDADADDGRKERTNKQSKID